MTSRRLALAAIALCACHRGGKPAGAGDGPRVLDGFEDLTAWRATGSEGVQAKLAMVPGVRGRAMKLGFDLGKTSGYAVAHRDLALDLSSDFELSFELSGELAGPPDNLELKLLDATGQNVWWYHRAGYELPAAWRHVVIKRKQIEFAWGPTTNHTLGRIAAIELVVSAGPGARPAGNQGWIALDELAIREVRPPDGPPPAPTATASSAQPGAAAGRAIDGDPRTAWHSDPAATGSQRLTVDLGRERDFSGLVLHWGAHAATDYRLELSRDGVTWDAASDVRGGNGGLDPFVLPETTARYIRLLLTRGTPGAGYELGELEVVELPDAPSRDATTTAFVEALGKQLPRGSLPRGFSGEQSYWTLVGVDGGGGHASLMSEDGALELASGASVEPFVELAGATTSWANAGEITQSLDDGDLPIPSVTWTTPAWDLTITAFAVGEPASHQLAARYTLHNRSQAALPATLVLAIRPLQVNPPKQFLNIAGGVRRIARIGFADGVLSLDGVLALRSETAPTLVGLWPFHALGYPIAPLVRTPLTVVDPGQLASGALGYPLALAPGASASIVITAPLAGDPAPPPEPAAANAWFDAQLAQTRAAWHAKLDRVGLHVPPAGEPIVRTLRSSLAYMLLSRDGAILRPGTRSYAKAWIRDGAMIGEALLRLGHPDVAAGFLRWYLPFQPASGKVPCCVEHGGAVPVPEHDSHGELIHLAAEVYRYTGDRALLDESWPHVQAAVRAMDELRKAEPGGLLPPSISHEGYSARPAYSYWDDFWAMAGYRDAAMLAAARKDPSAPALAAARDAFEHDLLASITKSAADHHIDFIPGAADLGDFDATSTTIGLSPGGEQAALPQDLLTHTFERGWQQLVARKQPTWNDYTPYELRLVGAFARLGWRDRAFDALTDYLGDRRPRAWNQWAEVVGRELRVPRFIGDMPHAWVHSDYARSVLDLFAYERAADHAYVLAAGVPLDWFTTGFAVDDLPTPYGVLSYRVTSRAGVTTLELGPGPVPPGGFDVAPPYVTHVNHRPATLVLTRSGESKQP